MWAGRYGLIGRSWELGELGGLVADVASGRGRVAWIQGEAGIGKSALADLVALAARDAGCAVFRGAGDDLMTAFPLRVMADCLGVSAGSTDAASAEIAGLLRGGELSGTIDPVLAASERLLELVDRLAATGPLALIVEDLHWADEPSLLLWNRLSRVVDQIPLLLLGTCRPVPARHIVDRLRAAAQDQDGVVLDLGPLTTVEVEDFAGQLIGGRPGPKLSGELARAGGNPLYVREMVNALLLDRQIDVSDNVAELNGPAGVTPDSLPAAIGRRLSFLSDDTASVLGVAAMLGKEFRGAELAAVTGRPATELAQVTAEAIAAGVIVDTGTAMMFRHDLIRQALAEQSPVTLRGSLHNQIARSLASIGEGVDTVARHLMAASTNLEQWVLDWLAETPNAMLYTAPQVSADLLTKALPLLPEGDPRWQKLASRLIEMLFWMGRDQQLRDLASVVVPRFTDLELAARSRIQWARSVNRTGRFDEGYAVLEPMLDSETTPVKWRPRIEAWAAASLITNGRVPEGRERAMHALEQARRDGDPLSVAYSLNVLTQVSDATTQIARYDEALAGLGSDDPDSTDMRIAIIGNRATPLFYLGRVGESQEALRKASMLAERNGSFRSVTFSALAMEFAYDLGNWDEVLVIMAGIDPAHLEGPQLNHLFGIVALVALHRDDRELAIAHLRAAGVSDFSTAHMYGKGGYVTPALALLAESDGDLDRGLHIQKAWLELDTYSRFFRQYEAQVLIRMALRAGDRVTAKAAAEAADVKHSPVVMPPVVLCSRTCHALVNDDVAELMAVAQENARMSFVEQSAFNYEEAAVRLAHAGDIPLARKAFTDAVQAYDQLGATWDIRRADARLLPFGIRRGSRSLHRRAKTGWAALTPTEARIAHLVAQGKSNPDIASELYISRNTVQTHVSNILAKLQVRSRIELVREVTRAQLP